MNHYAAIAAALEAENLDAVLLTGEANRFYASGFFTPGADATALVTKKGAVFFTDARYTEAAARHLDGAELREVKPGKGLMDQLKELVFLKGPRGSRPRRPAPPGGRSPHSGAPPRSWDGQ